MVIFIVLLLSMGIQSSWFQTFLAHQVANYYSNQLGVEVKIEKVIIQNWSEGRVEGLYIEDHHQDTLVYSPDFSGDLLEFSMNDKFAILEGLKSEGARIKLQKYEGEEVFNLQFLIDYFKSDEPQEESRFILKIKQIELNDAHLSYTDWNSERKRYGIDYEHLDLKHVSGKIKGLRNRAGITSMDLENIALIEQSGFKLDNLSCHLLVNPKKIKLEKLVIQTPQSNIQTKGLSLKYHDYGDLSDFVNSVVLYGDILPSRLNTKDLSYFVPSIEKVNHNIKIEGIVNGPVNDIKINEFYLGVSPVTFYSGDLEIKGLPDIENTLFALNIDKIQTSRNDLSQIDFTTFGLKNDLILPKNLSELGVIYSSGSVEGFYNDLTVKLDIQSDIGSLDGLMNMLLDTANNLSYKGHINTHQLNLGVLTNNKTIGIVNSNVDVDGKGVSLHDIDVELIGRVHDFQYMDYTYHNIDINGSLSEYAFKGNLDIEDRNIDLAFIGDVDFKQKPYNFSFEASLQKAHLYDLKLINSRESSSLCIDVEAFGYGTNLDDFTGYMYASNVAYYENGKDYAFDAINFESKGNSNLHTIDVMSEFANVSMVGEFSLDTLDKSLYNLGSKILPSIMPPVNYDVAHEDFNLNIDIKDLSKLTELFFPELQVSTNTSIFCNYNSDDDNFMLAASSEWIEYADMRFAGVDLDTTQKIDFFDIFYMFDFNIDTAYLANGMDIQNLGLEAKAYNDNIGTKFHWGDSDSTYWGEIVGDGYIINSSHYMFDVKPSRIYSNKAGLWHLDQDAHIRSDTTSIHLDNLLAINNGQTVRFDGTISEDPNDKLNFEIAALELADIDELIGGGVELDGLLNLDGYISNVYNDWYMDAYTFVEGMSVNSYYAGNFEANANWNKKHKRMEFSGELTRRDGTIDFVIPRGFYYINKDDNLDFIFDFNHTDIEVANAFLPEGMYIQGKTNGRLKLKGGTSHPEFTGTIFLEETSYTMDMLNTTYTTSGQVIIEPDMIAINGIPVKDKFGSEGLLVGSFFHQNFENYSYDFFTTFDNPFLVMNTTYQQNPLYYGDAFITGDLTISYDPKNLMEINVNAKSEKGTDITLPLYGSEEVVLQDFISFVGTNDGEDDYEVDLQGIQLNLSMDITEEAHIQLVFDEVVGDMMEGRGNGHIDMYIDQFYDFYMFGNFDIKEGSYLFTLKDFINKKFLVKEGSTIAWYGNPYEADIDIWAYYPLKASLYDIMPENEKLTGQYKQKTDVDCMMHLSQNLFNPNINFDITLPSSNETARTVLRNLVSTEQEMNKQVFSLLILNKFIPRADAITSNQSSNANFVQSTTSEVLSNQLSNMISNFSDDFDIGFNYRPGDNISNDEVAVAMSTQLFNDRLTIRTNLGVSQGNQVNQNPNSLIGDVDVSYKLNPPEGNLRVHAFNKSNEYELTNAAQSPFTQGVGVFYQESFDTFNELICRFKNLFRKYENDCKECADKEGRKSCRNRRKNKSTS